MPGSGKERRDQMPRPRIAPDQPYSIFHSLQSRVMTLSLIKIHLQNIHLHYKKEKRKDSKKTTYVNYIYHQTKRTINYRLWVGLHYNPN